jgi:hypothetical protein
MLMNIIKQITLYLVISVIVFFIIVLIPPEKETFTFPENKKFAFTIIDDTDTSTLQNIKPVYDLLYQNNIKTTKTVWVFNSESSNNSADLGDSLQNKAYKDYVVSLKAQGVEIASHGAKGGSSERAEILLAMDEYTNILGETPNMFINHSQNRDNLYWGKERFTFPMIRFLYQFLGNNQFTGHKEGDVSFWGDYVKENIKYVRHFNYNNINVLNINSKIPYKLNGKPFVNYWFDGNDGNNVYAFNNLMTKENIDRLEEEGGVCIIYTHFGKGFYKNGELNKEFIKAIEYIASKNGWFVSGSELLDHLLTQRQGSIELSWREEVRLEILWIWGKITSKL